MKKVYLVNSLSAVLFFIVIICYMTFATRTYGFATGENRNITKFPRFSIDTYLDGKYTAQISEWYTDSIPNRQALRDFNADIKAKFGIETDMIFSNTNNGADDSRPDSDIDYSFEDYTGGN